MLKNKYFLYISLFFSIIALSSCKMRAEQKSLTSRFEIIDSLIQSNLNKDAIEELKKTEKQAYDSWSYIGLYKRCSELGELNLAEKLLQKAIKKNNQNQELLAVYSHFLIENERYEEAAKISEQIKDGKYNSLYSEAVLKNLKKQETEISLNPEQEKPNYKNIKYYNIYFNAYKATKNPVWIKNCAIFHLIEGNFDNASALIPESFSSTEEAYFWSLVLYDSGKYKEAISALEKASVYLKNFDNSSNKAKITKVQIAALESDAYLSFYDYENAEKRRNSVISQIDDFNKITLTSSDDDLLAKMMVNSIIFAKNNGDLNRAAQLLLNAVEKWPDNIPAILLYTDFAYDSNQEREETEEQMLLRKAGITTIEMEKYDNRVRIPLNDALYRIDKALENTSDPRLEIKKLDLKYKLNKNLSVKEKTADLWYTLEENFIKEGNYQSLFLQYALCYLLKTKQTEDAFTLFYKAVSSIYNFNPKEDFWLQFEQSLPIIDNKIIEFGAWFAISQKSYDEAIRLYKYCVYEAGGIFNDGEISPNASVQVCMNLGDIMFSSGQKNVALDLYGKAAGRETNKYLRSEIFYRIACIHMSEGVEKNALRSVDYSVNLNPDNVRASLLKNRLLEKIQQ